MTLAPIVFKKSTFQKVSNLNALGSKDLDVQVMVNEKKTWKAHITNATIKSQEHRPSGSGVEGIKGFLLYFYVVILVM